MSLSKSQIEAFFDSPVWKEISEKIDRELRRANVEIEHPDPFMHGRAVGERRAYTSFQGYREILMSEASGKSPYGNKS